MKLNDLYEDPSRWWLPYALLKEREAHQNISHRHMPEWEEHFRYIQSKPHKAWYWFSVEGNIEAGCIYLSRQNEIGIGVLGSFQRQGLARQAIRSLMEQHVGPYLANVNPDNDASIALFKSMGFKHLSNTYKL